MESERSRGGGERSWRINKSTLRFYHFREHRFTSTFMHQDEPAKYSHIHPPFCSALLRLPITQTATEQDKRPRKTQPGSTREHTQTANKYKVVFVTFGVTQ